MATTDPECMQIGNTCRYADDSGAIHDAVIIELVASLDGIVDLSYNDGETVARNVRYSEQPTPGCWGCAADGRPSWSEIERVARD